MIQRGVTSASAGKLCQVGSMSGQGQPPVWLPAMLALCLWMLYNVGASQHLTHRKDHILFLVSRSLPRCKKQASSPRPGSVMRLGSGQPGESNPGHPQCSGPHCCTSLSRRHKSCLECHRVLQCCVALLQGGRLFVVLILSTWIAARALASIFDFQPVS